MTPTTLKYIIKNYLKKYGREELIEKMEEMDVPNLNRLARYIELNKNCDVIYEVANDLVNYHIRESDLFIITRKTSTVL